MGGFTPYKAIYAYNKLSKPEPPLYEEPLFGMSPIEATYMNLEGTLFNPYGESYKDRTARKGFVLFGSKAGDFKPVQSWRLFRPVLPQSTGNDWDDAWAEFDLIKKLNHEGDLRARKKFKDVQRYLYGKLTEKEKDLLKLADFQANEIMSWLFEPGMITAMGILRDYWPRWFGGKAGTHANFNPDIYWIPWHFFMEDDYINGVKFDLIANLFNDMAKTSLYDELFKADKLGGEITDFDFTEEDPLMWRGISYQSRSTDFCIDPGDMRNPKYWALGNFSLHALPKGTVIPLQGGGHRICVTDMHLFIHDTFDFENWAPLGLWDFRNKKFPSISTHFHFLTNTDFQEFREKHGYGNNFTVLSPLYRLPDFDGKCWDVK